LAESSPMADVVPPGTRSALMARVRSKDTAPERFVRSALHAAGFRFRLQRRDLPGRPDIVLPRFRLAVFVHGCFWHGHNCRRGAAPSSNIEFWSAKLQRNKTRDAQAQAALADLGWRIVVIWECELKVQTTNLIDELTKEGTRELRVP
jgi:DNA mismatch endonuclease, patch repair protein